MSHSPPFRPLFLAVCWLIISSSTAAFGQHSALFSPDTKHVVFWGIGGAIYLLDIETGDELAKLDLESTVQCVAISPNGKLLAAGSENGEIALGALAPRSGMFEAKWLQRKQVPSKHAVSALAFSPDAESLISGDGHGDIVTWQIWGNDLVESRKVKAHDEGISAIAFCESTSQFASAGRSSEINLWTLNLEKLTSIRKKNTAPGLAMAFSPDGRTFCCLDNRFAHVWDISNRTLLKSCENRQANNQAICFVPKLGWTILSVRGQLVYLTDPDGNRTIKEFTTRSGDIFALTVGPKAEKIALLGSDHSVSLADFQGQFKWTHHIRSKWVLFPKNIALPSFHFDFLVWTGFAFAGGIAVLLMRAYMQKHKEEGRESIAFRYYKMLNFFCLLFNFMLRYAPFYIAFACLCSISLGFVGLVLGAALFGEKAAALLCVLGGLTVVLFFTNMIRGSETVYNEKLSDLGNDLYSSSPKITTFGEHDWLFHLFSLIQNTLLMGILGVWLTTSRINPMVSSILLVLLGCLVNVLAVYLKRELEAKRLASNNQWNSDGKRAVGDRLLSLSQVVLSVFLFSWPVDYLLSHPQIVNYVSDALGLAVSADTSLSTIIKLFVASLLAFLMWVGSDLLKHVEAKPVNNPVP